MQAYPHLTLGDRMGLSHAEVAALESAADAFRRSGDLAGASRLWGLLISCDPYAPRPWRELAQLRQRLGDHRGAIAAFEVLARVADRSAESTYREALSCLELGEHALGRQLLEHAVAAGRPEEPWVKSARRTLSTTR